VAEHISHRPELTDVGSASTRIVTGSNAMTRRERSVLPSDHCTPVLMAIRPSPMGSVAASQSTSSHRNANDSLRRNPYGSATVTTPGSTDPNTANNTATGTSNVVSSFDLAVTKQANRASLPGAVRPVNYAIAVRNNGPSAATGVIMTDKVPLGLNFVSVTPQSGTCDTSQVAVPVAGDPDHGLLTCTLAGPIPVGGTQTITVAMQSPGDVTAGPAITETASVSAPDEDPTKLANNSATWTLSGLPFSDLALTKTAPPTMTAGTLTTYSFAVANLPTEENLIALAPTLTDTLPAGLSFVPFGAPGSVTPNYCTASGQNVTCALPNDINPGASEAVQFSVTVDAGVAAGTTVVNTAEVHNQPNNPDPAPDNNVSQATSTVVAAADLASAVSVTPLADPTGSCSGAADPADPSAADDDTGAPGSWHCINIQVTNNGPSAARGVTIVDALQNIDAKIRRDASGNLDIAFDVAGTSCTLVNQQAQCALGADLAPGASANIWIPVQLASYAAPGAIGVDTATVGSATPDPVATNNSDTANLTVSAATTHLTIDKTAVNSPLVAGSTFSYQITVAVPAGAANVADAQNVTVADAIPTGLVPSSVSASQGNCSIAGQNVTCALGTVSGPVVGGSTPAPVTISVRGTVDAGANATVSNTATAATTTATDDADASCPGADASRVCATADTPVVPQADLRLFKTVDPTPTQAPDGTPIYHAGESVGYTLTALNTGPSAVGNPTITDTLPLGLTLDTTNSRGCAVVTPQNITTSTQEVVSCSVGALAVGVSTSIRLVALTSPLDVRKPFTGPGCTDTPTCGTDYDPAYPRPIDNTASIGPTTIDANPANNTATASALLDKLADVSIQASVSTTTPAAGGTITYTAVAINNGPSAADFPTGDAVFPPGFVLESWTVPFANCTPSHDGSPVVYRLHCEQISVAPHYQAGPPGFAVTESAVLRIPPDEPAGAYTASAAISTTRTRSSSVRSPRSTSAPRPPRSSPSPSIPTPADSNCATRPSSDPARSTRTLATTRRRRAASRPPRPRPTSA
jgi:uncharacterized repeat protein (TIGR01451 family)